MVPFEERDLETNETIVDLRSDRTCYESHQIFGEDGTVNRHVIHAISGKTV